MPNQMGEGAIGVGAGAAAAAIPGLNALLLPLLLSFGPAFLSKLFGGNPAQDLQRKIAALTSAAEVAKRTGQFYQGNISSPAYSQAQGTIAAGANQTGNEVKSSLAARGIGTTGTGAVLSSLTPSLIGSQTAGLRTSAWNTAGTQAQESIARELAALTGTYGQASPTQQLTAGGLSAFSPYLTAWMKSRYPGMLFPEPQKG